MSATRTACNACDVLLDLLNGDVLTDAQVELARTWSNLLPPAMTAAAGAVELRDHVASWRSPLEQSEQEERAVLVADLLRIADLLDPTPDRDGARTRAAEAMLDESRGPGPARTART